MSLPSGPDLADGPSVPEEGQTVANPSYAERTIVLFCEHGPDVEQLKQQIWDQGLRLLHARDLSEIPKLSGLATHVFIELALPHAPALLAELSTNHDSVYPVAIVARDEDRGTASLHGATAALVRPLSSDEFFACLRRNQERMQRLRLRQEEADLHRQAQAASALDRVLQTLGYELRGPLTTALANIEYLTETGGTPRLEDTDQRELLTDTLDALHRLRLTLDGLEELLCSRPAPRERLVLLRLLGQLLAEFSDAESLFELRCDAELLAWGDKNALTRVLRTLLARAVESAALSYPARVIIHAYPHRAEARITLLVEGVESEASTAPPSPPPSRPARRAPRGPLVLALLSHAMVCMGGSLSPAPERPAQPERFRLVLRRA